MRCVACGVGNDPGRKFCKECGTRLPLGCAACGVANAADAKFCGECGSPLASEAASPSSTAAAEPREPETERRLVSVLFVDLVGFTSFSEGRDAEDVRAMLTRYFEAASNAVQRHGGTVEKFIGDAVMAVWGTPVAHEDDAERAVRSALEIVDQVVALGSSLGLDLQARAGVLTGEAVARLHATNQGIVTGDLVNTASRGQTSAAPGQVLVGERTFRSVSASITCVPVDALTLKGKAEQLPAWRALRVISERGGSNRGAAPEPPFVGRAEDLRLVKELLHATGRERRPRLLHITGVAGIGKSRLVWELQKYVDGLTETFSWHQGRCPAYGDGVTFWALAEMVRGRARIADTDDDTTARKALAACLEQYFPEPEERRWIEPRLANLIGLEGASGDRDEMFGAWRRFFERLAEHGTVVLVVEDLHWADPGLLDFVESLLEWSRSSPVIVVSLARPELADRRPTWGSGVRSATTLHLDRLADGDIKIMVTGYVGGLPADGLAQLVSRAEGIPMYAVETVRMLADRGVLEQTGGSYVVVGEVDDVLDIPETLHALVAARLDNLPEDQRALVQDASVAGQSFTVATVCAVSGHTAADVEPLLGLLVRKEVLDRNVDPRSAERGQYRFVQSVLQEVAHSTLSKAARRTKHLACAAWLEGLGEEELAGVVASHYLDAYLSEPGAADAESIADKAREWSVRAADRASSLGSPEQAFGYTVRALTLATTPEERAALHDRAARNAFHAGDAPSVLEHVRAACEAYRVLDDPASEARLLGTIARGTDHMVELVERLIDVETRLPEECRRERVLVLSLLAFHDAHARRVPEALDRSERALVLAQSIDLPDDDATLRESVSSRAFALQMAGRHLESAMLENASVAMARRGDNPLELAKALLSYGVTLYEDDPRTSLDAMLESARLSGSIGMRPAQALALANASEFAVDLGDFDAAQEALDQAAPMMRDQGTPDAVGLALTRAMLLAHRGEPAPALAIIQGLEEQVGNALSAIVMMRTWLLRARALVRFLAGDAQAAADDAAESLATDPAGGNASLSLWMAILAGSVLRDPPAIRAAVDATSGLRGQWTRMARTTARASLAALEDETDAKEAMKTALDAWTAAELPLDHAFATLCAQSLLPAEPLLDADVRRARNYLQERRADSLLRLLDRAPESSDSDVSPVSTP
jgi:class 3 adenylate cyclase/tetratricopeptide (TPR) repeat protein